MVDINLRYVVAATSLEVGITSLKDLCLPFDSPQPPAERSYQSYLKYLEEKLNFVVKEVC